MRISVKVKAGTKIEKIERSEGGEFAVWTREPARDGRANAEIIRILAKYFCTKRSRIRLVSGFSNRRKVFEMK